MSLKTILWTKTVRARIASGGPHFLERTSLRALSAKSATVLLEAARTERPDLILLSDDVTDLSVVDLYRQLRDDDRTRSIPVMVIASAGKGTEPLRRDGAVELLEADILPEALQVRIAERIGLQLRRYARYPVVLPVERGRIFREFLGYSNSVSEGGMGFETLSRIKGDEVLPLRIYRNSEEKPIAVLGRVRGVRPNINTGIGYAVGIEFKRMSRGDRDRLLELFPGDPCVVWGPDRPTGPPPESSR